MTKYFFCNKFVNEMFLRCNIKNLFGSSFMIRIFVKENE